VGWEAGGARLTSLEDATLAKCRSYDGAGRANVVASLAGDCSNALGATSCGEVWSPAACFDYQYDWRGNRTQETYQAGLSSPEVTQYGYDLADRLVGAVYPDGAAKLYRPGGAAIRCGRSQRSCSRSASPTRRASPSPWRWPSWRVGRRSSGTCPWPAP
jgi:hypothetical protein